MASRVQHIDIAKGLSISLVVIFHSKLTYFFPGIIEPTSLFRMPLFFFLSGVFFSWSQPPKSFLIKKSEALLKPYYFVLLLLSFIHFIFDGRHLIWELKGIIYGNGLMLQWVPMWFLTHLFIVYCFSYFLYRYLRFYTFGVAPTAIILVIFMAVGIYGIDYFLHREISILYYEITLLGLPFSLDILLISIVYFILGRLLKDSIVNFTPLLPLVFLSLAAFVLTCHFTEAHIDLNKRIYNQPLFSTIGALTGIYIILSISYLLSKTRFAKLIPLLLGRSSLYILIFHWPIIGGSYGFLSSGVSSENVLLGLAFLSFALGISVPLVAKNIIERNDVLSLGFLPFSSNPLVQRICAGRPQAPH